LTSFFIEPKAHACSEKVRNRAVPQGRRANSACSDATGITTPFTLPQFPFVQTVGQQSQDNINPAFILSNGPTVQVSAPNPNSGLGQGVFGTDRNVGSGYSQQWNFTVQKTLGAM
jgi:hypothetical protein